MCDDCGAKDCECDEIEELGICLDCRRAYNLCQKEVDECDCGDLTINDFISNLQKNLASTGCTKCLLSLTLQEDIYFVIAESVNWEVAARFDTDTTSKKKATSLLNDIEVELAAKGIAFQSTI